MTTSVLFVCLGNICRSPMAEAAFRAAATRAGVAVEVDSAGTTNVHAGDPPDLRAQATAARSGIDMSMLRARQVRAEDFDRFDRIIAMDHDNLADLRGMRPDAPDGQLSLMLDRVAGRAGDSVADPYYGGHDGFDRAWAEVQAGADALIAELAAEAAAQPIG